MKKLVFAAMSAAMMLGLAACSGGEKQSAPSADAAKEAKAGNGEAGVFNGSITVVVPFKAGSATDNQIRLMQGKLEAALGTNLVIVNAEGGSGTIGTTEYLTNYQADGYTILYSLATPIVYKPLSGDTAYTYEDLTAVARTSSQPMYLILSDNSPYQSAEEVLEFIKANPAKFTYANVGNGGNGHLAFASFLVGEGLDATSVPYSGGTADCYTAMMGGEVSAAVYGEADLMAREDCHGVINLGSKSEVEDLQDIPTLADLGYEGYETNNMAGFFYNKEVPAEMVDAFEKAVETVLTDEEFIAEASVAGFVPSFGTGDEMDAQSLAAIEKATPVLEALN